MKAIHATTPNHAAGSSFSAGLRTLTETLQKSLSRWDWQWLVILLGGFVLIYTLPVDSVRFQGAVMESLYLAKWYAQEHVVLCLVPLSSLPGVSPHLSAKPRS